MNNPSKILPLQRYRESVHSVVKPCAHCQTPFETKFGMYCSDRCCDRAGRARKLALRLKDLICWYCAGPIPKRATKFCCEDHKIRFHHAKDRGKPINIKIDSKTIISTKKYDTIPEVVKSYKERQSII